MLPVLEKSIGKVTTLCIKYRFFILKSLSKVGHERSLRSQCFTPPLLPDDQSFALNLENTECGGTGVLLSETL